MRALQFCIGCNSYEPYLMYEYQEEGPENRPRYEYMHITALCARCLSEMYIPWVNDENVRRRREAYAKASGGLTQEGPDR